jgi:hypothetical protein
MNYYAHLDVLDVAGALDLLPQMPVPTENEDEKAAG